ncbi:MAG: NTF2 fold immunity protein, partial [Verrucomicrobiota bacterium]
DVHGLMLIKEDKSNSMSRLRASVISILMLISISCDKERNNSADQITDNNSLSAQAETLVQFSPNPERGMVPEGGFVPDANAAVRVAEAVLVGVLGNERIRWQRPFSAKLSNNVWVVKGTLPPGYVGGTSKILINRSDGCVEYFFDSR